MLSWERHIQREEEAAIRACYATRTSMGLHPEPYAVDCEEQPCYGRCPFHDDMEEEEPTIAELNAEANSNYMKEAL